MRLLLIGLVLVVGCGKGEAERLARVTNDRARLASVQADAKEALEKNEKSHEWAKVWTNEIVEMMAINRLPKESSVSQAGVRLCDYSKQYIDRADAIDDKSRRIYSLAQRKLQQGIVALEAGDISTFDGLSIEKSLLAINEDIHRHEKVEKAAQDLLTDTFWKQDDHFESLRRPLEDKKMEDSEITATIMKDPKLGGVLQIDAAVIDTNPQASFDACMKLLNATEALIDAVPTK